MIQQQQTIGRLFLAIQAAYHKLVITLLSTRLDENLTLGKKLATDNRNFKPAK
jgi:hypothetical protein